MDKTPVILDTDIGSDIDDAVALAYLLKQPRCELLGVTVVTGDVAQRAACAEVVCRAAGRDEVPIHCGASGVLLTGPGQPTVSQYQFIKEMPHRTDWPANTAVDFLRRTIRSRPHEITLLTIGPLTNVALLFALDPEIPSLLKSLVSMAGIFFKGPDEREWNCLVDPIATGIVYGAAGLKDHLSVGLDVTMQCQMHVDLLRPRMAKPPLSVVWKMAQTWVDKSWNFIFHDPLAAMLIFKPELCGYARGKITVPLDTDDKRQGRTLFAPEADGPHRVAQTVNPPGVFDEYFSQFI